MPTIHCRFCNKIIDVDDFDFARWCKRELIFCSECYTDFKNGINKVRKCKD